MLIFKEPRKLQAYLGKVRHRKSIGFIPTMGDLHAAHLSLMQRSKKENDLTVVSIFVNPTQFDSSADLKEYTRTPKRDIEKLKQAKVDILFMPGQTDLYSKDFQTWVTVENLSKVLCGAFRPGHFRGVATVVLKLFHIVQPRRAYFGLKDFQQYKVIERMVEELNLPITMKPCPLIRQEDGLAMSSRNRRLSVEERKRAIRIVAGLKAVVDGLQSDRQISKVKMLSQFKKVLNPTPQDKIEYLELVHPDSLMPLKTAKKPFLLATAVWIGKTRLIDNLYLK
jgi:pantoate--beta-alanine ligase